MNLTQTAAAYAANLSLDQVPADVQHKARQALRDHIACTLAGSQTDLGSLMRQTLTEKAEGPARLWGTLCSTAPGVAAFCNAVAANAMDFDDTSGAGHPGASVIPAAFAAASINDCSGRRLLTAIIVGYEVGIRTAAAIRPSWERYRQVHGIGTGQVFGAAAAACHILGLDAETITRAFGIAGTLAPVPHAGKFGWDERPLTWMKDNVAWPAEAGLRAALLARAGLPASHSILDGDKGFWIMASSDQFDPTVLEAYDTFQLMRLSLKPYPCCRWLHTTLGAVAELQADYSLQVDSIGKIHVDTILPIAEQFMEPAPQTMVDAQFSLPHAVAMKLLHVDVSGWWKSENRTCSEVQSLMRRVQARHDPSLTERYLAMGRQNGCIPVRVEVRSVNGKRLQAYEEVALGEPNNPLAEQDQVIKFETLTRHLLSQESRQKILSQIAKVETLESVQAFVGTI